MAPADTDQTRRRYLTLLSLSAVGSLAGCRSNEEHTDDTPAETDDSPNDEPARAEQLQSAEFVVRAINGPDRVQVGKPYSISIVVENVGGEPGTYTDTIESSVSTTSEWQEDTTLEVGPIEPGATEIWESEAVAVDNPGTVQLRLVNANSKYEFHVVTPEAAVSIDRSSFVEADLGYRTPRLAEVALTNTGGAPAGSVDLSVDWFDNIGQFLASTSTVVYGLMVEETWLLRADPEFDVERPERVTDFDVTITDTESTSAFGSESLTITTDELRASAQDVLVRATVENTSDATVDYYEVIGKVYNHDGAVIGFAWTNETNVEPGATFRYELRPNTRGRNSRVTTHEVLVADQLL